MKSAERTHFAADCRVMQPTLISVEVNSNGGQAGLQKQMAGLAREIAAVLSTLEPTQSKEVADSFVSELLHSLAKEDRLRERRQRQATGIAAAKARGVHFGPRRQELPGDFEEFRLAWRSGQMTLREAAEACGLPKSTFHDAALRVETGA